MVMDPPETDPARRERERRATEQAASVERAWRRVVAARVAALDAGEIETIAWEVRGRLLLRLREGHQRTGTGEWKRARRRFS